MSVTATTYVAVLRTALSLLRAGQEPEQVLFHTLRAVDKAGIRAVGKELRRDRIAEAKRLAVAAEYSALCLVNRRNAVQRLEQLEALVTGTKRPYGF
jgi:hypothetical protein